MSDPPVKYLKNNKCDQMYRIFSTTFIYIYIWNIAGGVCSISCKHFIYWYNRNKFSLTSPHSNIEAFATSARPLHLQILVNTHTYIHTYTHNTYIHACQSTQAGRRDTNNALASAVRARSMSCIVHCAWCNINIIYIYIYIYMLVTWFQWAPGRLDYWKQILPSNRLRTSPWLCRQCALMPWDPLE